MNSLCQTCRKLLYRTDPCRGVGVECGRTDGGSKQMGNGGAHATNVPRTDLPEGGAKSTAARKVVPVATGLLPALDASKVSASELAGTQAPPVDTKLGRPRDTGPSQGKSKRAAQMREYQRKRRANKKAEEAAK